MVIWNPEESSNEAIRRLYELCRQMGAPRFLSEGEMEAWVRSHFDSLKGFVYGSLTPVIDLLREVGRGIFGDLLKTLLEIQRTIVNAVLREQMKRTGVFKSLHAPLDLIPQSLRPIESAAY